MRPRRFRSLEPYYRLKSPYDLTECVFRSYEQILRFPSESDQHRDVHLHAFVCCLGPQPTPEIISSCFIYPIPERQIGEHCWTETINVPPSRFDELDTSSLRFTPNISPNHWLFWRICCNQVSGPGSSQQTNSLYVISDSDPALNVKMIIATIKTGAHSLLLHERRDSSSSSTSISARASSGGLPPGSIAAIVLGSLAFLSIICSGAWFFFHRRRRNIVRSSSATRIDLGEAGVTRVESPTNMHATGIPGPVSFPHSYERGVRRYPLDPIRSIEPSRSEETGPQKERLHSQTNKQPEHKQGQPISRPPRRSNSSKTVRRHTTPLSISRRPPIDQLDRDLAYLRGEINESMSQKPFQTMRPLPPLPVPTTLDLNLLRLTKTHHKSKSPSNKSPRSSRRKRAATLATPTSTAASSPTTTITASSPLSHLKDTNYNRLPPSANYLAEIAKYPDGVDPDRPWNVLKDNLVDVVVRDGTSELT